MKALVFNKDNNMDLIDIDHYRHTPDPRSRFAIWCCGEGWCPATGPISVYSTLSKALAALKNWEEENPYSKYEIREVV